MFVIDQNPPTLPSITNGVNGSTITNSTHLNIGRSGTIEVAMGQDSGSGIARLVCQTSIGRVDEEVVSFFSFSPYSENLLTNGSDDFISCRFIDKVGNPSAELNFTVSADFQLPIPIFTSNTVEGYQFFDTIFTGECLDEHQDATLVLMVQEPNSSTRNQTLNKYELFI